MAAYVYAMGQRILLLDEPLANLDRPGTRALLETLRALCAQGYAVLLVEHRLDVVLPYADRVCEIVHRTVVERPKSTVSGMRQLPDTGGSRSPGSPLLSARGLAYSAGAREILRGVDLTFRRGERVVLLGENGCGKTTLLRLLAGLVKPDRGTLRTALPGKPGTRKWFRRVGYVYQEPSYQLFMPTVQEELRYGTAGDMGTRVQAAFGLDTVAQRHPQALSEGQKRRVGIAAVLAASPTLLLLDEPTVGQDFESLRRTVDALNRLHRASGSAMLTVTHDYRCAGALADRVLWMERGQVIAEGGKEIIRQYYFSGTQDGIL